MRTNLHREEMRWRREDYLESEASALFETINILVGKLPEDKKYYLKEALEDTAVFDAMIEFKSKLSDKIIQLWDKDQ